MEGTSRLGEERVDRLLLKLATPAALGILVMVIFSVVDAFFVGRYVGAKGLAGLAVNLPLLTLLPTIGMAIGIGGGSLVSRSLGAKKLEDAKEAFGNVLTLTLGIVTGASLLAFILHEPLLYLYGGKEGIYPFAKSYFLIGLIGSPFLGMAMALSSVMRAEGNSKKPMIGMSISAVLNIILDYVFIIQLDWGLEGAAWATVISQVWVGGFFLKHYINKKSLICCTWQSIGLNASIVKEILKIGLPSFLRQAAANLTAIAINNSLFQFGGESAVAVYGILNRLFMFFFFPILGIVQGFLPIAGFNYGAQSFQRVKDSLKVSIQYGTWIGVFFMLIGYFYSVELITIFSKDTTIVEMGSRGLQVVILFMPVAAFQVVGASYFQAIGKAKPAFWLTLSRQVIFQLPLIIGLPFIFGIDGVWYAFPIADLLSTILTSYFLSREWKKLSPSLSVSYV